MEILEEKNNQNPIKFICLDNFLKQDFYEKIKQEIKNNNYYQIAINEEKNRYSRDFWYEGENLLKLHNFLESDIFTKYLQLFFGTQLKRENYFEAKNIKTFFPDFSEKGLLGQFYKFGDHFGWHIDGPIEKGSLGTFTYYLYNSLEKNYNFSDGGFLELGKKSGEKIIGYKKIPPFCNRIIILPVSEFAWHRVAKITNKSFKRFSIQSTLFKN